MSKPPTPLVFIPGLLCDAHLWARQQTDLADLAPSLVADVTRDDTVQQLAARLLASAPPTFRLISLSMGGYIAFEVWRQAPERVEGMALLDTSAAADSPERRKEREASIAALALGRFAGVTSRLLPRLIDASRLDSAVGEELKAMALRVGGDAFVRQQKAILSRPDSGPLLPHIQAPALVAVGDGDVLTPPSEAVAMFRALPNPTFHLFHRCGHLPALEQPAETSRILRTWLQTAFTA